MLEIVPQIVPESTPHSAMIFGRLGARMRATARVGARTMLFWLLVFLLVVGASLDVSLAPNFEPPGSQYGIWTRCVAICVPCRWSQPRSIGSTKYHRCQCEISGSVEDLEAPPGEESSPGHPPVMSYQVTGLAADACWTPSCLIITWKRCGTDPRPCLEPSLDHPFRRGR